MQIFNKYKKAGSFGFASCKDLASAIVANVPADVFGDSGVCTKIELSKIGKGADETSGFFLNIFLNQNFI